jgi:hypothetical protein
MQLQSLPRPSDGLILEIRPRLEGHLPIFSTVQTPPPVVFLWSPIAPAYAGAGLGRRSSIRLKIFRNSCLAAATPASWNVTYRPWLTTFAPTFTNFSRNGPEILTQIPFLLLCHYRLQFITPSIGAVHVAGA